MVQFANIRAFAPGEHSAEIGALIEMLGSPDAIIRGRARTALVMMGQPAVRPLGRALFHPDSQMRWEAAKALRALRDPAAAPALLGALEDERVGVRWLAGEALIALGYEALALLMEALSRPASLPRLGAGARHVLRGLAKRSSCRPVVAPVLAAMRTFQPGLAVPPAARRALRAIQAGAYRTPGTN